MIPIPRHADHHHRHFRGRCAQGSGATVRLLDLINYAALCQLLKERGLGVRVRQVIHEEVDIISEFFAEI